MVLGIVARDSGSVDEALRLFQQSIHLAKEIGDADQAARSALAVFRIISEREAPHVVASLLTEVRTLTTRAGDSQVAALLHESVARYEAQVGNVVESKRHLRAAKSLLEASPNSWLEQLCEINGFCIEFSNSELVLAEAHLRRAQAIVEVSGALEPIVANNLGHLYLQAGDFVKAEKTLQGLIDSGLPEVRRSALDGLARVYLASGQLQHCRDVLDALGKDQERGRRSFPGRANLITKLRLLLTQGSWVEAVVASKTAVREAEQVADQITRAMALLLQAQALVMCGEPERASRSICNASSAAAWDHREHQGMFSYLQAQIIRNNPPIHFQLLRRADRIWHEQGNTCAQREFGQLSERAPSSFDDSNNRDDCAARAVSALAGAVALSYNSSLLAAELLEAIEACKCSPSSQIVRSRPDSRPRSKSDREVTLTLGDHKGEQLSLVCQIPDDPRKAILLSDILRLGEAARALERAREEERNRAALWPESPIDTQSGAVFLAEEMQTILATARRVAASTTPVLITGETGTGKEVLARTIHACSKRAQAAFLPFNCASTPKDMLDSQLFGHRRGAFTGAVDHFPGLIRTAAGGTLFLDEIGDMALDVQPKLLRFLDSGEILPIGDTHPKQVDVRVIVATNADLDALVSQGRFREDLLYRLDIYRIHLPPLRERRVEIPTLAHHYLQKYARELEKHGLRLAEETMEYLVLYKWPGNVRQLASEMRRLATDAEPGAVLMPEHLSPDLAASRRTVPASERTLDSNEIVVRSDQPLSAAVSYLEQRMIEDALRKCDGRMEDTAAMLGLSRKGLYLKRQRLGIELPPARASA
jgi:DNA-binding NtrC family response regulator